MTGELIPRTTVRDIVAKRDRALKLYERAYGKLVDTASALAEASAAARQSNHAVNAFNFHQTDKREKFIGGLDVQPRDDYLATARHIVDVDTWAHVIELTDLEKLMDKTAKDQLRQQLYSDPPEATVENIYATLRQFMLDADTIFQRGIAECFSALDRRFRSHDGWKIGSRVILSYAFNDTGHWSYGRNHRDTLIDIERTFYVLEGLEVPEVYHGIVAAVDKARAGGWGARQTELETEFFKVRIFKNGNCHLWFKRDDLLEKVNKLLGEYYGEAIPKERTKEEQAQADIFEPKTTLAKRDKGFFPTPPEVVAEIISGSPLYVRDGDPQLRVLEPSAGTGNIARAALEKGCHVDCVEVDPNRAAELRNDPRYGQVIDVDFLKLEPAPLYDRVLMNPPFDMERDIDHVMHALKFLKPNGYLCAVMSAGTEFRETRKSAAFRELVKSKRGNFRDLPAGSFSSVGTNVNTLLLRLWNDGRQVYW